MSDPTLPWLSVLIDTAQDTLDNDGGYLAADEREQITAAIAAARPAMTGLASAVEEAGVRYPLRGSRQYGKGLALACQAAFVEGATWQRDRTDPTTGLPCRDHEPEG